MASLVENTTPAPVETATPPPTPLKEDFDVSNATAVTPSVDDAKILTEEELERKRRTEMMAKKRREIEAALEIKRAENAALAKAMFAGEQEEDEVTYDPFAAKYDKRNKAEKLNQTTCGGSKGKEGNADHTAGKSKFVRPCTVGWKSQNQPLQRGGGGRTPRQKG
ncbi:hypothetical protein TrLO_g3465 [Triparma laevis f. longispina]|uniref:Uncharacterized protein n=1 Tax=Triparma laevis f. longispina TaxID=1714387 RepID=A0A9W6ZAB8_9STRA|nr:hypothetical protein TrLO_g3465 [Triparma laevis f. longispina]